MRTGRFVFLNSPRRVFLTGDAARRVPYITMRACFVVLTASLLSSSSVSLRAADAAAAEARSLVSKWIAAGAKTKSLEIDFVQERRLKALRMPLTKPGKIWFQRPDSFRWQIGAPPSLVAVRKSGGELRVADVKEKTLRVWSAAELAAEAANGKEHGFAMAGAGFPSSLEAFEKTFEIRSAMETSVPGVWDLHLDLRDRKAGIVVKEIVFTIEPADGSLKKFDILMRDGSVMTTRVLAAKKNSIAPAGTFQLDESGLTPSKR